MMMKRFRLQLVLIVIVLVVLLKKRHHLLSTNGMPNKSPARAPIIAPCSPHKSLSYIKIHKTGSGAMHNLLIGLALRYNLTVALPHCKVVTTSDQMFPQRADKEYMLNQAPLKDYHNYNVFLDHAVYDRRVQMEYMAEDVRFVTQIRHPFSQARSGFHHFGGLRLGVEMTAFLNSNHTELVGHGNCFNTSQSGFPVTSNFQAFTLGYTDAIKNTMTHFKSYLQKLDNELFFVSLLEFSDESSILLRRMMCWHMRDVLNLQTHRTKKSKTIEESASQIAANEHAKLLHKQWSSLDYMLYDHFKEKLLKLINQQGPDFQEEVQHYKAINARFSQLCTTMCEDFAKIDAMNITLIRRMLNEGGVNIPATTFFSAFRITYVDCLLQKSKEPVDKKVLKVHQYPVACDDKQSLHLYTLDPQDCDFSNHVYPGYHINHFKQMILNKDACLGGFYNG